MRTWETEYEYTEALISRACTAAEEGLFVFPVLVAPDKKNPGKSSKTPLLPNGHNGASNDPEQIVKMDWEKASHYGINCEKSGIWVVDVDDKSALAVCPLAATRMQETVSGGQHYLYKAASFDQRNTTNYPVKGIDIRANGGFIVWYGDGEMIADTIQPWPWKAPLVPGKSKPTIAGYHDPMKKVGQSGRNNDLISACGAFIGRHPLANEDELASFAFGHSTRYHDPALSAGECHKVAMSAMRWRSEGVAQAAGEFFGPMSDLPPDPAPGKLCGDWLREKSYNILYGRGGFGKTAVLAELVWCLKHEEPFFGMETRDPGKILWINGDLPAWQVHERIGCLKGLVDLWHIEQSNLFERVDQLLDRSSGYGLVIYDNRPALFRMGDVNSAESWGGMNILMRQVCSSSPAALLAGHSGKGEVASSFGSSAQEWVADNILSLMAPTANEMKEFSNMKKLPTRALRWEKHRLSGKPDDRLFYIEEHLMEGRLFCEWRPFVEKPKF